LSRSFLRSGDIWEGDLDLPGTYVLIIVIDTIIDRMHVKSRSLLTFNNLLDFNNFYFNFGFKVVKINSLWLGFIQADCHFLFLLV
jgi:hypothetical protein